MKAPHIILKGLGIVHGNAAVAIIFRIFELHVLSVQDRTQREFWSLGFRFLGFRV